MAHILIYQDELRISGRRTGIQLRQVCTDLRPWYKDAQARLLTGVYSVEGITKAESLLVEAVSSATISEFGKQLASYD